MSRVITRSLLRVTWFGGGWVCLACSSTPPPEVPEPKPCELKTVKASLIASDRVNLSEAREPRPVQIRLYQLKNDTRFLNADFAEIWQADADVLGDDLLKVEELPVYPNSRTQVSVERDDEARFLVAAGLFRNPKGKSWFSSFEFPEPSVALCGDSSDAPLPEFFVWVEGTRVEDGTAHAEEFPDGQAASGAPTTRRGAGGSGSTSAGDGFSNPGVPVDGTVPSVPDAPQAPTAPELPTY